MTTERAALLAALKGDGAALRLCEQLFAVSQVWDDLVDRDKEVAPETVNAAFWLCLVEIPANPFWRRHEAELRPVLSAFINAWLDASELERGGRHERTVAFGLRDACAGLVAACARLIGGYGWMREISPGLRRLAHDETLEDYLRRLP